MSLSTVAGLHFISVLSLDPSLTRLISPLSSFLRPYLFISVRLIFVVVVSVDSVLSGSAHLARRSSFFELSVRRAKPAVGGQQDHLWWSVYCPAPICRGPQYNIHSLMHNTKNQSWVKDNSKACCLSLDYGTGTKTAKSRAGTLLGYLYTAKISVWKPRVCLLIFPILHIF